jgi:hypothetical protein
MIWPIFHIILVNHFRISSWRLFGWGMYATPNPGAQSQLNIVGLNNTKKEPIDITQLHTSLIDSSLCVNLFIKEPGQSLKRSFEHNLCEDKIFMKDLDYFMHFASYKHLAKVTKELLSYFNYTNLNAYAFFTHRRVNIFHKTTYLESDVYRISFDKVEYLGKVKNEG